MDLKKEILELLENDLEFRNKFQNVLGIDDLYEKIEEYGK